jgi:hypothetical protein
LLNTIYTAKYNTLWWIKYILLNTIYTAEYHTLLIKTHLSSNTTQFCAKYLSLGVLSADIIKYFGQLQNSQSCFSLKTFVAWGRLSGWNCGDKTVAFGLFISDTRFCTERKTHLHKIFHTHWVTIPANSLPVI